MPFFPFWPRREIPGEVELLDILRVSGTVGSWRKGREGGRLCRGRLCDAPLTACALNGKVWGDALVTGVEVTLTVALGWWLEVTSGTAQKILPQILEQMPGETHVDPGVTAAVEAGQQHGDDERHGCRRWDSEREITVLWQQNEEQVCFLCEGKCVNGWLKVYLLSYAVTKRYLHNFEDTYRCTCYFISIYAS